MTNENIHGNSPQKLIEMEEFCYYGKAGRLNKHFDSVLVDEYSIVVLKAHEESKQSPEKLNDLVAGILQVFVDARHAVPKHRYLDVLRS